MRQHHPRPHRDDLLFQSAGRAGHSDSGGCGWSGRRQRCQGRGDREERGHTLGHQHGQPAPVTIAGRGCLAQPLVTTDYLQYLFPGILVMGAGLAGMVSTGTNINLDLKNGVTDRFRSLPISRLAPLLGSVLADIVRYLLAVAILFTISAFLGFRIHGSLAAGLAAAGLAILFGFCLSWVTVLIGVLIKTRTLSWPSASSPSCHCNSAPASPPPPTPSRAGYVHGPTSIRSPTSWTPAAPCSTTHPPTTPSPPH